MREGLLGGGDEAGAPLFQPTLVLVFLVETLVVAGIVAPCAGRQQVSPTRRLRHEKK